MAMLGFGGCETQDLTEFSATSGTCSMSTSVKRNGTASFRTNPATTATGFGTFTGVDAEGLNGTAWSANPGYIRTYLYIATAPASASEECFSIRSSAALKLAVRVTSARVLAVYAADGTTLLGTGTTVLLLNTWYRIEVSAANGTSAAYSLYIDGNLELSGTGNLAATNVATLRLGKGTNRNGQSVDFYHDDWCVSDTSFIGPGECRAMALDGNGTYTALTGTYTDYDETPSNGDTDYVSTAAAGAETATCASASASGISGRINGVKACIQARFVSGVGGAATSIRLRSASTNSDSTLHTSDTAYELLTKYYTTDPATSLAWSPAALDGVEVGCAIDAAIGADTVRMTYARVHVDCTPDTPIAGACGHVMAARTINMRAYVVQWTSTTAGAASYECSNRLGTAIHGRLHKVVTIPSPGLAPTANYDITLDGETGSDVLQGTCANRSASAVQAVYPASTLTSSAALQLSHGGRYVLSVTNAGSLKSGTVVLYVVG